MSVTMSISARNAAAIPLTAEAWGPDPGTGPKAVTRTRMREGTMVVLRGDALAYPAGLCLRTPVRRD